MTARGRGNAYGSDLAWIHHAGFSEFAESAAPGVLEILRKHGLQGGLVVELGCGSGILARELTASGFRVLGFDPSPAMIALARETAPAARFETGGFVEVEIPPCDAVIAMGEVLNYGTLEDVRSLVARAATSLLVFDVAERGSYPGHEEGSIDGPDWTVILDKRSDGTHLTRRILTFRAANGTMQRDEETHTLELYDRTAMTTLLEEHGYRVRVRRSYGRRRLPKGHAVYVAARSAMEN